MARHVHHVAFVRIHISRSLFVFSVLVASACVPEAASLQTADAVATRDTRALVALDAERRPENSDVRPARARIR